MIRKCEKRDIAALRRLALDTAYFGEKCEFFFPDRALLGALIMDYYLLYEPEHTWVAECKGDVVGYLSAGTDDKKYSLYMLVKIIPQAMLKALLRGKIWNKKTFALVKYNMLAFLKKETDLTKVDHKKYPVHIHQNVKAGFRGKKIGSRLVEQFLAYIDRRKLGIRFKALRQEDRFLFFERYGFKRCDCKRASVWEGWLGKSPLYYMRYVREPACRR